MVGLGITLWSVFFLVPTGRARVQDVASADSLERVFHRMYELAKQAPFDIKMSGNPLESAPFCAHVPARYRRMVERGEAEPVDAYFARRIRTANQEAYNDR